MRLFMLAFCAFMALGFLAAAAAVASLLAETVSEGWAPDVLLGLAASCCVFASAVAAGGFAAEARRRS